MQYKKDTMTSNKLTGIWINKQKEKWNYLKNNNIKFKSMKKPMKEIKYKLKDWKEWLFKWGEREKVQCRQKAKSEYENNKTW